MKRNIYSNQISFFGISVLLLFSMTSCKKYLQIPAPPSGINSQNVYTEDATAIEVLNGIYVNMQNNVNLSAFPGCSADELTLFNNSNTTLNLAYTNNLNSNNNSPAGPGNQDFWTPSYTQIYVVNSAISGLNQSATLTPAIKQQLIGEAEFIRAYYYFYLVNFYGDVPLALTTDYKANASLAKSPAAQVYQQIIADLTDAQTRLSANFLDVTLLNNTAERVRPTKWAATALLARAYLYYGDLNNKDQTQYQKAAKAATAVIQNTSLFGLVPLSNVFLANNNEVIWQLEETGAYYGQDTQEAYYFIIPSTGPSPATPVGISPFLLSAFEAGDQRRLNWIDSVNINGSYDYYAYKYKNNVPNSTVNEFETLFRLAEQYLIVAEADAEQGDLGDAAANLNIVRNRAGLPNTTASSQSTMLTAILHERQVEFFTEWGHRWFDLKRTGNVNAVMSIVTPKKGGSWNPNQALYPIPLPQIQADPYLKQNPGY